VQPSVTIHSAQILHNARRYLWEKSIPFHGSFIVAIHHIRCSYFLQQIQNAVNTIPNSSRLGREINLSFSQSQCGVLLACTYVVTGE